MTHPIPSPDTPAAETITSVKGFKLDWTCRDYQFAVGQTYQHDGPVEACKSGFHACEYPLDVFDYYPPGTSRYAEVVQSGEIARHIQDTKVASSCLTVLAELSLADVIQRAVRWTFDHAESQEDSQATGYQGAASATGDYAAASATGDRGAASATGDRGAASATGYQGAASATGYQGAASATGYQGAALATGYQGAASATGDRGAASATGDYAAASATGDRGAASATGYQGAASATGYQGAASATGDRGAALATGDRGAALATGDRGAASATGYLGAALATGIQGRVMGAAGNALFLVYRDPDTDKIIHAWAGIAGRDGIKAETWYRLDETGRPVEIV